MPRGRPRNSGTPMNGVLGDALRSIQSAHQALSNQRANLDRQIGELERMLGSLGNGVVAPRRGPGRPPGSGRGPGRPPSSGGAATSNGPASGHRPGSLKDVIHGVLAAGGSSMKVAEITECVVKSGYDSKNKTLGKSVGIALASMKGVRKVGRGTYKLA